MRNILIAVVILLLAWSIGAACKDVGTADYLVAIFSRALRPELFALTVFGLACLVSFSTGTSYGTMAILLPNVVPLALAVGESGPMGGIALVVMSVGAVLEGAIFGDHCSPISDTTILSAVASRCDTIEHVRTQMPYAVTAMGVAVACGYVPVAFGIQSFVGIGAGVVLLVVIVRWFGRAANAEAPRDAVVADHP
jgi:Na+/H+ antiporter NhaC